MPGMFADLLYMDLNVSYGSDNEDMDPVLMGIRCVAAFISTANTIKILPYALS